MNNALSSLTLAGTSTYSGATTISAGSLAVNGQLTNSSVFVQGGLLLGSGRVNNNVTLSSGGVAGTLAIGGNLTVTGNGTWYAQDTVSGGATVQSGLFALASGAVLTTPALNVTGGAIAAADGTSTLNGSLNFTSSTSSTFLGAITGPSSTVTMNNALSMLTLSGTSSYGGGTTVQAGTLQLGSNAAPGANTGSLAVNLGGLLDLNGFSAGVGGLNGGGTIDNVAGVGTSTLTFGNGNAGGTFSGTIQNSSPSGLVALVKTGAGTQFLSGVNTYTGGTTLSGGILNFSASSVPVAAGSITFNGGTLQYAVGNTQDVSSGIAPMATGLVAAIDTNGNIVAFGSGLSGAGGLTKLGGGMLTLNGVDSYLGATTITPAPCSLAAPTPCPAAPWRSTGASSTWRARA